jgi:hypothetical protein
MTWHEALSIEIAAEFRSLTESAHVAYLLTNRRADVRVETPADVRKRRVARLIASGNVREARKFEARSRGQAKRRKAGR